MSLTRWDPFEEMVNLRDAMNQLFEESFIPRNRPYGRDGGTLYRLPVDVYETGDEFVVEAVVPGLTQDQLNIEYQEGRLIISGEVPATAHEDVTYHLRERWFGTFRRAITFPSNIDPDNIDATLEHGVLSIYLPKAEEAKTRQIPVKTTV